MSSHRSLRIHVFRLILVVDLIYIWTCSKIQASTKTFERFSTEVVCVPLIFLALSFENIYFASSIFMCSVLLVHRPSIFTVVNYELRWIGTHLLTKCTTYIVTPVRGTQHFVTMHYSCFVVSISNDLFLPDYSRPMWYKYVRRIISRGRFQL